jgi:hypothetical protein
MNQTKKRLNIIKLAISITDIETIQLQILKLTPMKSDASIQEIISLLQEGSYVKAQSLITTYMEITPDSIEPKESSYTHALSSQIKEKSLIDEFDLMITPTVNTANDPTELSSQQLQALIHEDKHHQSNEQFFENSPKSHHEEDNFFEEQPINQEEPTPSTKSEDKEQEIHEEIQETPIETVEKEQQEEITPPKEEESNKELPQESINESLPKSEELQEESYYDDPLESPKSITPKEWEYQPIPHIAQKMTYMEKRYPPVRISNEKYETVDQLLEQISSQGYDEKQIEETINTIQKLINIEELAEAAELLHICASTESLFGQFMLARELYTGAIIKRNIDASFSLMDSLAKKEYPEALCDLGQFYEHGIGTVADLDRAEHLYKGAMEGGIKRAMKHHARLQKENKGFF